jgi:hypothetical protein
MKKLCALVIGGGLWSVSLASAGEDIPAARLFVKPLLCVIDREAGQCSMTFRIRWKSEAAAEYCLNDSALSTPLRCWPSAVSGTHDQQREVSEAFIYWLGARDGTQRAAEVKIDVLRLDSQDRRRERRARHVGDVL